MLRYRAAMAISPDEVDMMGADSNCLTFVVDAFEGIEKPSDPLAEQRIALARIFFYSNTFLTTPTVKAECEDIPDPERRAKHHSWMMTHFGTLPVRLPPGVIARRAQQFHEFHRRERDCMVLAEAEATELAILLSFDFRFLDHLAGKSTVRLMKPLDCWNELAISKGATPKTVPHPTNPLAAYNWWRW